ncbi:MAG: molybdopterin oxidoreductase family protein [Pseudomonadota bacterium]
MSVVGRNHTKDRPIDTNQKIGDEVKYSTCYMCACRCGIKVHLKDGAIRYIEGNPNHPINKGVLCAKGSAGIMQHYSPARLTKPLLRVGERGAGEFKEIEWDEALQTATMWLSAIRNEDPRKLAFFTGRDQSQALTGWWASQFGTPNYAAHGGFCSVNMASAGLYSIGGSFWEFGQPDWDRTKYLMMFGVAEDHDSNPIKTGLAKVKANGAKFVSINPIKTGYSAIADEWVGLNPGTDGLFILSLVYELLRAGKVDADYLARYTNAPYLVIQDEGAPDHGLFARDEADEILCHDRKSNQLRPCSDPELQPSLTGAVRLPDGRSAVPAFALMAQAYSDPGYAPDAVADRVGIPAEQIRRLAAELAQIAFEEEIVLDQPWTDWRGKRHETMIGRPVSMHAMRGISAHSNGFHTCRAIHLLQVILGSIDCPGGFRYKPPFPRPTPPGPRPAGKLGDVAPNTPLPGPPLGFPMGPEDLLVDDDGQPLRIDKAFSWENPLSNHGMLHMVISNAWRGDPYPVDTLFMYMANMAWNSAMNTADTIKMLTDKNADGEYKIPRLIYSDAYYSETVAYADLVLPDTTYLERWDCISVLDRPICEPEGPADSIRQPVVAPDRDVRPFQEVLLELGARLGLPGMSNDDGSPTYPGGYPDYLINHQRKPGVGSLMGWRGEDGTAKGRGAPNPNQLQKYIDNQCFWQDHLAPDQLYFKHSNQSYLNYAARMGFIDQAQPIVLQIYSEIMQRFRLAAEGHGPHQPPELHRERVKTYFDPLPLWYAPFESACNDEEAYPLYAVTQRPMAMYHSWGSQNAWLRQIHGSNRIYISEGLAKAEGIKEDDWIWVYSRHSRIKAQVRVMMGLNEKTIWTWNAIGKRKGAWNLDRNAGEASKGFLLNHLIDDLLPEQDGGYRYSCSDPVTGQAAWYDLRVRIEKALPHEGAITEPQFPELQKPKGLGQTPAQLRYGAAFQEATGDNGGKLGHKK